MTGTPQIAPELADAIRRCRYDYPYYSEKLLRITNKVGRMVPFVLNEAQMKVHQAIEAQLERKGRVRVLILKARQMGISTYVQGRFFWRVTSRTNANAFVLSHLEESTHAIFEMAERFYDNIPHPAFRPATEQRTSKTLRFAKIKSKYRVGTARSGQTGRSMTNQFVHGSEVAYYPDPEQVVTGLIQSVDGPGTEIILESTANGAGGWFYDRCMEALRGEGEWELIFLPWFDLSTYRRTPPPHFRRTEAEESLANLHGLDNEQLQWRREKVAELGSEDLFRQEYPSNPNEAFLTSGRCFVDQKYLDDAEAECWSPAMVGELREGCFVPTPSGRLRVWLPPQPNERYCIGVDVAEGLEHGDYSCGQVLDSRGRQVAVWHGHEDPFVFGDQLKQLATWYRKAWLVIERNNHGLTTIRRLQDLGYPNMFVEQTVDNPYADKLKKRAGWLTTTKTKPLIIDNLAALLVQGQAGIADIETVRECRTYMVDSKGRTNAMQGRYDDRVMAFAIALFGLNSMPRENPDRSKWSGRQWVPADPTVGY